jgi:hypothetical protein
VGSVVQVVTDKLPNVPKAKKIYRLQAPPAPVEKGRPEPFVKSQDPRCGWEDERVHLEPRRPGRS